MSIFRDRKRGTPSGERTSASPPASGVSHIADIAAAIAASNAEELLPTGTAQAHSRVRRQAIPEAAAVFSAAMSATGRTREDVAAALDLSTTIVSRWTSGRSSIPSDCVWGVLRRDPDFGEEILYLCLRRLDMSSLRRFTGRALSLLAEREKEAES